MFQRPESETFSEREVRQAYPIGCPHAGGLTWPNGVYRSLFLKASPEFLTDASRTIRRDDKLDAHVAFFTFRGFFAFSAALAVVLE